ncbi:MAG: AzlC family ABC transporter permease [Bacteroidales bacterium]|nr:AzlC family ABC transporter permease [Bacteroidales bacterium]
MSAFFKGVRDGIPIAAGYFAVAFSLGITARNAGLTAPAGFLSSFLTRASAGEYGVYAMMAVHASFFEIAAICLIANLRYLLMGAALTQKFAPETSLLKRILTSCCITDEIFGISIAWPGFLPLAYPLGATTIAATMWGAGTASGISAGELLPPPIVSALSVALYGMFLAIIIPQGKKDRHVLAALLASFVLSWCCAGLPVLRGISPGIRTVVLTVVIAAAAAWLKPLPSENDRQP